MRTLNATEIGTFADVQDGTYLDIGGVIHSSANDPKQNRRLLLVVDDTQPSKYALARLVDVLRGTEGFSVLLAHMIMPFPPELIDIPDPEAQAKWLAQAKAEAAADLNRATNVLKAAGIPADSITREFYRADETGEWAADAILDLAREKECFGIVIGHGARLPWYRRVLQREVARDLESRAQGFMLFPLECKQDHNVMIDILVRSCPWPMQKLAPWRAALGATEPLLLTGVILFLATVLVAGEFWPRFL
jgi:nucleotide-binding universal stress UspA family protein